MELKLFSFYSEIIENMENILERKQFYQLKFHSFHAARSVVGFAIFSNAHKTL